MLIIKKYLLVFSIIFLLSLSLSAQLEHKGFLRSYWGTLTEDSTYSVLQNTLDWQLNYRRGSSVFFANPVFDYNALTQKLDISLRQAYLDLYFDNFDLRFGKQQIIWGKADGVFITDVISPRDLSEFILPNFEEVRIGINALKFDYYLGNSTVEAVWIPVFQSTVMPDENSIWFPDLPDFPLPVSYDHSQAEIESKISKSELAARFSYLGSAFDLELMAAYTWDDNPVRHIYLQPDSTILIMPKYHRLPLAGAGFSKSLGGAVVRAEAAWYFNKKFAADDLSLNGINEKDYVHYLIGYDHSWYGINISLQFIQEYIRDYEDNIRNDEFSNTMTCLLSEDFWRETMRLEMFAYYGMNDNDALLRPKIVYDLADGVQVQIGANIFVGDDGNFGQYNKNDLIYLKARYDF